MPANGGWEGWCLRLEQSEDGQTQSSQSLIVQVLPGSAWVSGLYPHPLQSWLPFLFARKRCGSSCCLSLLFTNFCVQLFCQAHNHGKVNGREMNRSGKNKLCATMKGNFLLLLNPIIYKGKRGVPSSTVGCSFFMVEMMCTI
jgi:hypothetical protein